MLPTTANATTSTTISQGKRLGLALRLPKTESSVFAPAAGGESKDAASPGPRWARRA